jgi:cullin-5
MLKNTSSFSVSLKTNDKDKYKVYTENFERAYINETTRFYKQKTGQYLAEHGILSYLHYADQKLKVISSFLY